jgi:hypothetical protein
LLQQGSWPFSKVEEGFFVEESSKRCSQDVWRESGGKEGSKIFIVSMINGQREHHRTTGTVPSTLRLPAKGTEFLSKS